MNNEQNVEGLNVRPTIAKPVLAEVYLSDEILIEAFHVLFGRNYKKIWTARDKAREMRSIMKGCSH